jgi:PAS domain S-box-containing protein
MHKFPITQYQRFEELPLSRFNELNFSIYIIDFDWNYLFVNDFVKRNLGSRADNIIGKNMWEVFPELAADPSFQQMKRNTEKRVVTNLTVISPINSKRINIVGYPLEDCFYFSSSVLPDKDDLLRELRNELGKKNDHL